MSLRDLMRSPVALVTTLVCVANFSALGRGAYNRSTTEAEHTLTSRELSFENPGDESTVTMLRIVWVQEDPPVFGRAAAERVGFDCSVAPEDPTASRFYMRQLQRQVYVALEFNGPAWERYRAAQEEMFKSVAPAPRPPIIGTRLVAVDVDRDPAALRQRYPDRSRYLISKARMSVRIGYTREPRPRPVIAGAVRQLIPSVINVPRPLSSTLRELMRKTNARANLGPDDPRYHATIRYGRSHEPWLAGISP